MGDNAQRDTMADSFSAEAYATSALERIMMWPVNVLAQGLLSLSVPTAILIGFLIGRFRIRPLLHPWGRAREKGACR